MSENFYTEGSEALNRAIPAGYPEKRIDRRREKRRKLIRKERRYANIKFAPSVTAVGFLFLSALVAGLLYSSLRYLTIIDKMNGMNRQIGTISLETAKLKSENDNREMKIYAGVNFEKIRYKALNELGMVYPYKNHVITYKATSSGYVRQYGELNGSRKLNIFEKILSMFVAG